MKIKEFFQSTKNEMSHVVWPKRKEVVVSTILVVVISVVIAYILGSLDVLFSKGLESIISN